MTTSELAAFWRRTGRRVLELDGSYWYSQGPWAMACLPDHGLLSPSADLLARVARQGRALVLRYSSTGDPTPGRGLFVCSDRTYDLHSVHVKARSQTRGGLARCSVERIDPMALLDTGYRLNADTWTRQGRSARTISRARWGQYCRAAADTRGCEAWAAFSGTRTAAFVLCAHVEGCYTILYQSSATELLSHCPNNALTYTVTRQALDRPDVDFVSYGLRSVESTPGLDHFKERMGFHVRPHRENVLATPLARHLLSCGGASLLRALADKYPSSDLWRKAAILAHIIAS